MIRILILSLFTIFTVIPPGQPEIDYQHKRLYKELEREWGMVNPTLVELGIPDSLTEEMPGPGKYFRVSDSDDESRYHYIYIGRVNSCRAGGCSLSLDQETYGDSEYFDYFILFDSLTTVQQVRVFNYQATHGQEVSAKGWLRQFDGYDGSTVLKVGKDIDAISGATISVYGITRDVQERTRLLARIIR